MQVSRKRPRLSQEGFSLVEIMVAMTFLAVGLLGIAQLVPMGMRGVTEARLRTNAVLAGQRVLDDLRAVEFDSATLTAGAYSMTDGRFDVRWTISDNDPIPGMKRVELFTTWGDSAAVDTVGLSTYITRNL